MSAHCLHVRVALHHGSWRGAKRAQRTEIERQVEAEPAPVAAADEVLSKVDPAAGGDFSRSCFEKPTELPGGSPADLLSKHQHILPGITRLCDNGFDINFVGSARVGSARCAAVSGEHHAVITTA